MHRSRVAGDDQRIGASGSSRFGDGEGAGRDVLRGARPPGHAVGVGGEDEIGVGPQTSYRGGRRQQSDPRVHERDLHPARAGRCRYACRVVLSTPLKCALVPLRNLLVHARCLSCAVRPCHWRRVCTGHRPQRHGQCQESGTASGPGAAGAGSSRLRRRAATTSSSMPSRSAVYPGTDPYRCARSARNNRITSSGARP